MAEEKAKLINPDSGKELSGLLIGLMFMGGLIVSIVGFVVTLSGKLNQSFGWIIGDVIWLGGTALIVYTLMRNFKNKHGKGFNTANIVLKFVALFLSLIFIIIANTAKP